MASSSTQTSFSTNDLVRLGCTKLNDNVYELYKPASGPISMQIVFFHGFQTRVWEDAFIRTWMTHDGSKCWLNTWLVESIPQAHILSVSYDFKPTQDMYLIGENLARILVELLGIGWDCLVVLVGHCVGGLVLKDVCLKASEIMQEEGSGLRYEKFLANLRGMFFYDTVQLGSHIPLTAVANPIQLQGDPLLTYLHLLSTTSARITKDFRKLRRRYNWMTYGIMELNEAQTVMLEPFFDYEILLGLDCAAAFEYEMVVDKDLDKFTIISDVDYFTISSPKDKYSKSFVNLINFLEQFLEREDESNRDLKRRLQLDPNWICFDERIHDVIQLLDLQNPEPKQLSIIGVDGIGKSTLVKQILVSIQCQFDFACFLEFENVPQNQNWTDFEKLFAENLYRGRGKRVSLDSTAEAWSLLKGKKVLIIVDDVEDENQFKRFQKFNQFQVGEGSRLIITTCNKSLMSRLVAFIKFDVPFLSKECAQKLFRAHVDSSLPQRISRELVSQIVDECDGFPLALQLTGHYLSRKKEESIWKSVWEKLRIPTTKALDGYGENRIWKWFKVIFEELNLTEQKIFLDLATFDVYGLEKSQYDLNILKVAWSTGLGQDETFIDEAIENLRDRCLLRIILSSSNTESVLMDAQYSCIYMHKLLRNIGRWLSRPMNEEVDFQHSRGLWELQQLKDVRNKTKVMQGEDAERIKRLEVLSVAMESNCNDSFIKWSSISRFEALRLLRMSNVDMTRDNDEFILPQSLAMLHLIDCSGPQPKWSNWPRWQADWPIRVENVESLRRLSVLLLDNCKSVQLPENIHRLQNLRILQIHDSTQDTVMHLPETFGLLPMLEHLSLSVQMEKLPDSFLSLSSLKSMRLIKCSILKEWPMPTRVKPSNYLNGLTSLELSNLPALKQLPDTFGELRSLQTLSLDWCSALEKLPEGFSALEQLKMLDISHCERLETLCESFHSLSRLLHLALRALPALRTLPGNVGHMPSLQDLIIEECSSLPQSYLDLLSLVGRKRLESAVSEEVSDLVVTSKPLLRNRKSEYPGPAVHLEPARSLSIPVPSNEKKRSDSVLGGDSGLVVESRGYDCLSGRSGDSGAVVTREAPTECYRSPHSDREASRSPEQMCPQKKQLEVVGRAKAVLGEQNSEADSEVEVRHEDGTEADLQRTTIKGAEGERTQASVQGERKDTATHCKTRAHPGDLTTSGEVKHTTPSVKQETIPVDSHVQIESGELESVNPQVEAVPVSLNSTQQELTVASSTLRPDVLALGFHTFDHPFDPERTLCIYSVSEDVVEILFFHVEGMAILFGIGLSCSVLLLRKDGAVEVRQFEEKVWMHNWSKSEMSIFSLILLNTSTLTAPTSGLDSTPWNTVQELSPEQAAEQFGVGLEGGDSYIKLGEFQPDVVNATAITPSWIGSFYDYLKGKGHEGKDGHDNLSATTDLAGSLFSSSQEDHQSQGEEVPKVTAIEHEMHSTQPFRLTVRVHLDRNNCTFYNAGLETEICLDKKSCIPRFVHCETGEVLTSVDPAICQFRMVPTVTIDFLYYPHLKGREGSKKMKTALDVNFLIKGSISDPDKFGWYHDQLLLSFKCTEPNEVRRERREIEILSKHEIRAADIGGSRANSIAVLEGKAKEYQISGGHRSFANFQTGRNSRTENTVGRSQNQDLSGKITALCLVNGNFSIQKVELDSAELAYLATIFPPFHLYDVWNSVERELAHTSGMMAAVPIQIEGDWEIREDDDNSREPFCKYEFSCQRELNLLRKYQVEKKIQRRRKLLPTFLKPKLKVIMGTEVESITIHQKLGRAFLVNHSFSHMQRLAKPDLYEWDMGRRPQAPSPVDLLLNVRDC